MQNSCSKIQIFFDRNRQVERCDFSSLIEVFNADKMTSLGLRKHCDSLQILFHGYARERRLPFVIPELRSFLQALRREWPFAAWFCDLNNSFLGLEAMAHVENFTVMEIAGSKEIRFQINSLELRNYVHVSHELIRVVGKRAGMTGFEIRQRQRAFDTYIYQRFGQAK